MALERRDIDVARVRQAIVQNWGMFVAFGVLLIVAGTLAIVFPALSTLATSIALGWLLMATGIFGLDSRLPLERVGGRRLERAHRSVVVGDGRCHDVLSGGRSHKPHRAARCSVHGRRSD